MSRISKCSVDPPASLPSPHGRGWIITDTEIQIQWMDDLPAPEEVLKLCSCKCPGKETPCKSRMCTCKANGLKCTSFCGCNTEKCQNSSGPELNTEETDQIQSDNSDMETSDESESDVEDSDLDSD